MIIKCEEAVELHVCVESAMDRLTKIWDRIGISGEPRTSRRGVVLLHLRTLLEEMVREEDALKDKLLDNVEKFSSEVHQLCLDLGLPIYRVPESMTVLHAEKDLRQRVENLNKEKQDRMKKLKTLLKADEQLSTELATLPYHILSTTVPTMEQLNNFQSHIQDLEKEKQRRQKLFSDLHEEIISLLDRLELSPNTSFERNVVCESDTILMSLDNLNATEKYKLELTKLLEENKECIDRMMKKIEQLWDKLDVGEEERMKVKMEVVDGVSQRIILVLTDELTQLEKLKMQNIKKFIIESRKELLHIWDRCYICDDDRKKFTPFYSDDTSEELLLLHEQEVAKMNDYYHNNQEMLMLVAKRQLLWQEFLELERRANNPDRYSNRGGNLLKEEKQRKKVINDLPKVEQEVMMMIEAWERENNKQFLVGGVRFDEFVQKEKDKYLSEKENEKHIRHQQKAKQMEEEVLYGSRPVTPGNKRFANFTNMTPTKTPNKSRKLDTPIGSSSRLNTIFKKPLPSPQCLTMKLRQRTASRQNIPTTTNNIISSSSDSKSSATIERAVSCQTLSSITNHNNTPITNHRLVRNVCGGSLVGGPGGISTTVIASSSDPDSTITSSLCPVGHYDDFANNLNKLSKNNARSTIIPKQRNL